MARPHECVREIGPVYSVIKFVHVSCVLISALSFFLRGVLMLRNSPLLDARWLKIAPHINDTLLLAAAITLVLLSHQYPLVDAWLTAKVLGLCAYIALGTFALSARYRQFPRKYRLVAWISALAVLVWIVSVAYSHHPAGFFYLLGVQQG